jgi:hypothetical protein
MFPHPGSPTYRPGLLGPALALALVLLLIAEVADGAERSEAARVRSYWTAQRMESARPLDLVIGRDGEPHLRLGRSAPPLAAASFVDAATPTAPPFSANGRLFIRIGDDRGYCSATAIDSPTRQLVLTAGHCVNAGARYHGNLWYRDLLFVPAYTAGKAPFGAFPARRKKVFSPPQWTNRDNPDFDLGAFLVMPNKRGIEVAEAVGGGAAIALDLPRNQRFASFGYPGNFKRMQTCTAGYGGDDRLTRRLPGPPTLAIGCRWAPGASGGGWLVEDGRIDGLNSYLNFADRFRTYGPYFTRETVGKLVEGL